MMAKREKSDPSAYSKMELSTKVSGSLTRIRRMAAEFKFGQMDPGMTASGETAWLTDTADSSTPRAMCTRESGAMIKPMDTEFILISMAADTRVNGSKISNMASVSNSGLMELSTKDNTSKV